MADIRLGDLLHWKLGYAYRPPAGQPPDAGLERPIGWAVTIRAAPPVLPALRGGEIVVVPPRVLDQLEQMGASGLTRDELAQTLAGQAVAALLTAPDFSEGPLPILPLLVSEGGVAPDAEATLNRLLTERRAELYRVGSELSRVLTTSSVSGAGIDALLAAAAQAVGRPLLLLDTAGAVVAASNRRVGNEFDADAAHLALDTATDESRRVGERDDWLALRVRPSGSAARQRAATLLIGLGESGAADIERLALTQTAQAVELLLGHAAPGGRAASERAQRETLAAELALGRLGSREVATERARLLGLDPAQPTRVVLATAARDEFAGRLRACLPPDWRFPIAPLAPDEQALIVPAGRDFDDVWRALLHASASWRAADPTLLLVASDAVAGAALVDVAVRQARALACLSRAGAIAGPVVDAGNVESAGAYVLLTSLLDGGNALLPDGASRLETFAACLLAPLEAHDARRGELVDTLDAWLAHGGALAEAARALGVHRNTLSYRLARIADLTGRDLSDPRERFLLQLALAARALIRASAA